MAVARQLGHDRGIDALVLDRADTPASSWRQLYDGFRLNTCGFWSHLPGQRIPRRYGRWPGREDMVSYFDEYARRQGLRLRLGVTVHQLDRDAGRWRLVTDHETFTATAVIVAAGNYHTPMLPPWPGLEQFTGAVLHAADYQNALPYAGRDVLVVGSGNSGTDIALQLCDGAAGRVRMAIRTPPHLVPRAVAGLPVDAFTGAFSHLPVPVLDRAAAVAQRLWFGDLSGRGLPAPAQGIYSALLQDGRIPTVADELVTKVRGGRIEIVTAVERFDGDSVLLTDGTTVRPDVVIAATGYRRGLESMVGHLGVLDADGAPLVNGTPSAAAGLWFAGYEEPLIGPLRSFRRRAPGLAADVAAHLSSVRAADGCSTDPW